MRPSTPPGKHVTRPREEVKHAPLRQRFAVLLGGSAPPADITLIEVMDGEAALRHRFAPLADFSSGRINYCIGLLPVSDDRHVQRIREASVHRGRAGGKKPDLFFLLQAAPEDFNAWPRVKREGLARAAVRQGVALEGAEGPHAVNWWLALEFALHGCANSAEYRAQCARFELPTNVDASQALKAPGKLVATEYLQRAAESTRQRAAKLAQKNPFWLAPDTAHLLSWLEGLDQLTASMVLEQLARDAKGAKTPPASAQRTTLSPKEHDAAARIFERVAQDEPVLLRELQQTYASSLNVIAWLLEAHQLVASPGYGVLFEMKQLLAWLAKLPAQTGEPGVAPGVGELRKLGLPRRKAEALRDVLEDWPWLIEQARAKPKPKLGPKGVKTGRLAPNTSKKAAKTATTPAEAASPRKPKPAGDSVKPRSKMPAAASIGAGPAAKKANSVAKKSSTAAKRPAAKAATARITRPRRDDDA